MTRNIGALVEVAGASDGPARLVRVYGNQAEVEYFVSPVGPKFESVTVPFERVQLATLAAETRVYHQRSATWAVGRVMGQPIAAEAVRASHPDAPTEDHYAVRFPNGRDELLPSSSIFVRWRRPLVDPTEHLAARVTETPLFYTGRAAITQHLAEQRSAFGGLPGLASAAVELLQHQVTAVRHVLRDPVRRYLLADEVGLGKTIQACALIRQHLLEGGTRARILVIVPLQLVAQWRSELADKFFIRESDSRVEVVPEGRIPTGIWTLLVVDEAHRYSRWAFAQGTEKQRYEQLCRLARDTPAVLLLSGTPVLDNEDGFLSMLHVLDPSSYSLGDVAAFRQRVRDRLAIAEIIADLSDTASDFFVEDALDRANTLMSSDSVVGTLSEAVRRSLGGSSGASDTLGARRALRVHIGETYRIHRRMLRSRRADPSIRDHLPRRNGAVRLACEDMARLESFDIIDTWRAAALREISPERTLEAATLMAAFVDAAFSHPLVLLRTLDERLNAIESSARPRERFARVDTFFDGELDLLRGRRALLEARIRDEPRAERLAQWLLATPKVRKAVVFVDDSLVANRVSDRLAALLGAESVLRQTTNSVHAFEESPRVRVLVCDASAEEGLNLQRVGAAVVHYDVPLSATRIEQRIGRTDRIAARGRPTNIVFEGSATYDTSWLQCLEQAIQIFDRSTAPLQYVVAGAIGRVRHHLLEEGATAFLDAVRAMMDPEGGLEAELRRIQHQEAIDALEVDSDANRALFEDMVKMDERLEDDGQDAFERWLVTTLQFTARHGDDDAVRYAYSVNRPTLLPLTEVWLAFDDCIERSAKGRAKGELPMKACTFSRSAAEGSQVGLVRIGHPLVDAVESLLRHDDRGRAFAMWRVQPSFAGPPRLFLQFDFVVEADVSAAVRIARDWSVSPSAVELRADEALPPRTITVFLDDDLVHVTHPDHLRILERAYVSTKDGGSDLNIRHDRWRTVDELKPVADWEEFCTRGRRAAELVLRSSPALISAHTEAAKRHRYMVGDVVRRLESRISLLTGPTRASEERTASLESALGEALAAGIESYAVRVEAVGAIYLAATAPIGAEGA